MGNAALIVSGIVDILIKVGVGIRTVKDVRDEFKGLFPDYDGYTDSDLIDKYEVQTGLTKERLRSMLEE